MTILNCELEPLLDAILKESAQKISRNDTVTIGKNPATMIAELISKQLKKLKKKPCHNTVTLLNLGLAPNIALQNTSNSAPDISFGAIFIQYNAAGVKVTIQLPDTHYDTLSPTINATQLTNIAEGNEQNHLYATTLCLGKTTPPLPPEIEIAHATEQLEKNETINIQSDGNTLSGKAQHYTHLLNLHHYNDKPIRKTLSDNGAYLSKMLLGFLIFQGARYVESYVVMSRSQQELEASALALQVMRVMILISVRPLEAIHLLGASAFGARNFKEIETLLKAGWAAALTLSLITIPFLLTSELWLNHAFGQDATLSKMAGDFLKIYAIGMPALTLTCAEGNILHATNSPGMVAITELGAATVGILLSFLLVAGKPHGLAKALDITPMGLNGLAISFVSQKWMNFFLFKLYFYLSRNTRQYKFASLPSANELKSAYKRVLKNGIPMAFQMGSEQLYLFIITAYAGRIGNIELAQANILLEYFTALSITGSLLIHKVTMQMVGVIVGQSKVLRRKGGSLNQLQSNDHNIITTLKAHAIFSMTYATLVSLLYLSASKPLVDVYNHSDANGTYPISGEVHHQMSGHFRILALCTLLDTARNLIGGGINGLNDVISPMIMSIIFTVLIGGGLGALLTFTADYGLNGVLAASATAYGLGALLQSKILYAHYNNRSNETSLSCCSALFSNNINQTPYQTDLYEDDNLTTHEEEPLLPSSQGSMNT